ncbi:diguanylate cyclase, partial [Enterococcus faecium]|uniref:GGDEF domain-containing protein n=1 Tax=Enterococcus faecium TaxID=1352 RepID=UPI0010C20DCF
LQALSFGADDFITKPISNENLVTSVKLRLARNREIKSLIERDSLTGLVKHGAIKDSVLTEFERMNRNGEHFCVAMVDLDHFKNVNDSYGHAIGDLV